MPFTRKVKGQVIFTRDDTTLLFSLTLQNPVRPRTIILRLNITVYYCKVLKLGINVCQEKRTDNQ